MLYATHHKPPATSHITQSAVLIDSLQSFVDAAAAAAAAAATEPYSILMQWQIHFIKSSRQFWSVLVVIRLPITLPRNKASRLVGVFLVGWFCTVQSVHDKSSTRDLGKKARPDARPDASSTSSHLTLQ